jgi:hypothetical protein
MSDGPAEIPPPTPQSRPKDRRLARFASHVRLNPATLETHSGFVLIASGISLIVLAAVFADKPAVAPLFVVFGAAMIILGAFSTRLEGNFEATKDGVRAVLRGVERAAADAQLGAEDFRALLLEALDQWHPTSAKDEEVSASALAAVDRARETFRERTLMEERRLAAAVTAWLTSEGYAVEDYTAGAPGRELDLVAHRANGETCLVELKARNSPISSSDVHQLSGAANHPAASAARPRLVLAIPSNSGGFSPNAIRAARELSVELYVVDSFGDLTRIAG